MRRPTVTVWRAILVVAVLATLGSVAAIALATAVPTPTITAHPANPTTSTSASFSFSDKQAGVTFVCSLDSAAFTSCTSPQAYSGLSEGSHKFQVEAQDASLNTSSAATSTWTIDLSAPTPKFTFPLSGKYYNGSGWSGGCTSGDGICGTATDKTSVASVQVALQQGSSGLYWDGTAYESATAVYMAATVSGTSATSKQWFLPLSLPSPDGAYTAYSIASDNLGNTSASPVTTTFNILTSPPPTPTITQAPDSPTASTSAAFKFTDSEPGVTLKFQCSLDGGAYAGCTSGVTYTSLSLGDHTFGVEAFDPAGNVSAPQPWSWTIIQPVSFTITGSAVDPLYPGGPLSTVALTISNPNDYGIYVTGVSMNVINLPPGCPRLNFGIGVSGISASNPVFVPANGSTDVTSRPQAPGVRLLETGANQDGCHGIGLTLKFGGSAHS